MPLPTHYLITPGFDNEAQFLASLEKSLQAGTRLMQLKAKGLDQAEYRALATRVIPLAHRYDCQVLLSGDPSLVDELGADGLHLDSKAAAKFTQRPLAGYYLIAVSGHSLDALKRGEAMGASFAVLSPINYTSAHPDIEPLGWQGLQEAADQLAIPIYALGGVSADDEPAAKEAGAQGIAGNKGYWNN
ncbi:MAG: thiamine phosphate synthase [Pseudomonadota bacterium]